MSRFLDPLPLYINKNINDMEKPIEPQSSYLEKLAKLTELKTEYLQNQFKQAQLKKQIKEQQDRIKDIPKTV